MLTTTTMSLRLYLSVCLEVFLRCNLVENFLEELLQEIDHGRIRISCKKTNWSEEKSCPQTDRQTDGKKICGQSGARTGVTQWRQMKKMMTTWATLDVSSAFRTLLLLLRFSTISPSSCQSSCLASKAFCIK